jgi:hypothetical protein
MSVQQQREDLTDYVLREWDVCRRTAEFFDNQLGRLREIGIASSVAIIGLAVQFQPLIGILLLPLNAIFTLLDRRSQQYLAGVASYAAAMEKKYEFFGSGLTHSVRSKIGDKESSIYRYFVYVINAGFLATGSAFLWLSLPRLSAIIFSILSPISLFYGSTAFVGLVLVLLGSWQLWSS